MRKWLREIWKCGLIFIDIKDEFFIIDIEENFMAVTIKDVAKLAGVSPSTVSRTCKNHPSISQETKDRVKKAMEELGYEQNNLQQNISMRKIGVVFPKSKTDVYENPFYLEAIKGIGKYCNKKQYTLLVITGETDEELIRSIKASEADGFIFYIQI